MPDSEVRALIEGVLKGEDRVLAKTLTRVEDSRAEALPVQREIVRALVERTPDDHFVVGLTGPPGGGKSTLAGALIRHWTDGGSGVGMTAVDPSSRRSGGALLGDRARITTQPGDRVFVRSMASRERLGGLAPATRAAVVVLRAAFPWTLVETVGVGQSEVDVETVADCVILVLQPGSGDTLQFMKAGILEIPDVLVVHKWDLGDVAMRTRADLESILGLKPQRHRTWKPTVLGVSSHTGEGIPELAAAVEEYRAHAQHSGELAEKRERSRVTWVMELFETRYGSLGLERVGGRAAAERFARETEGTALDVFSTLADRTGLESRVFPA